MIYRIYCDGALVYDPNIVAEGYAVSDAKLTQELNKAGSLTFTLPANNVMYNDFHKLKSVVTVFQDDEEIFRGRVLQTDKDFYNRKKVYCEGELAYLLDSILAPYEYSGSVQEYFKTIIVEHNRQMTESEKSWVVGKVTVTDPNDYIVRSNEYYTNTWQELNDKLLNTTLGGYLKIRESANVRYIDYLAETGGTSTQVIEFGKNMLDFEEFITAENIFTVLIPLGADGITVESVNNGSTRIKNDDGIKAFGTIVRTYNWDDVTEPANLLTKGKALLAEGIKLATTLSVKAVDLHLLDVNTEKLKLGDHVRVVSVAHAIDDYFVCSKIYTDLLDPSKTEYTLGVTRRGITDK